jgi:serine/threonine-protein kinase RsbW
MTSARRFPNDAQAARAARQFALASLAGYAPELLEVVELLVSELATNSVRHTNSGFELRISSDPSRIRISVTDRGPGKPAVQKLDPTALSGRGLALVEMLSSSWGVRASRSAEGGKTVWLTLDVSDRQLRSGSAARSSLEGTSRSSRGPRAVRRRVSARRAHCRELVGKAPRFSRGGCRPSGKRAFRAAVPARSWC